MCSQFSGRSRNWIAELDQTVVESHFVFVPLFFILTICLLRTSAFWIQTETAP